MELDLDVPLDDGFTIEAALLEIHCGGMSACLGEGDDDVCIFLWRVGERRESSLSTRTRSLFVVFV